MTILEALQKTTEEIKAWAESKFFNKNNVDSAMSATSENPVQNKVVNAEIDSLKNLIGSIDVSEQISSAINAIDYPVDSVNGKTGDITLTAGDVGALPSDTIIPSIDGLATETYVNEAVAAMVDSAPETLNTLNELAAALGDDPNFATTIATEIGQLEAKVGETSVSEQISTAINEATADDFGIYVQSQEPDNAVAGDIWIDTANDPSYIPPTLPEITEADNGKVLMVVNGKLQLVNLNLSVDADGVVSM